MPKQLFNELQIMNNPFSLKIASILVKKKNSHNEQMYESKLHAKCAMNS